MKTWFLLIVASVLFCSGCKESGIPTYEVHGRVEFQDGTAVRSGFVETINREHQLNARGKIEQDGSFQLTTFSENDGAVAGIHEVIVVQFLGHEMAPNVEHDHGDAVATIHSDYAKSGLSLEVQPDSENQCVLTVSKQPR